jgi:hypothetical protein
VTQGVGPEFKPQYCKKKKILKRKKKKSLYRLTGSLNHLKMWSWECSSEASICLTCLACERLWVQSPALKKKKEEF